jgi:peroxiredoxin Q/BCP
MIKAGTKAPYFEGLNQDNKLISLDDYRDKKLVLYFYPKDLTPGCTIQARNLTANLNLLSEKGYEVLGVSADSVKRHCNFIDKIGIGFPLLSDESLSIIKAYEVWGLKKFMGREYEGIKRTTFLIDEKGVIEAVIDKVKTKSHTQQILDLIEEKIK